jgi:hypothetical protein
MTDFDVRGDRGTTIEFTVTVNNPDGTPVDLTLVGTHLVITGKLKESDAAPLFQKTYIQGQASPDIAITGATHNVADVTVRPNDTAALTQTSYVLVDAVLTQPSGKITTVASGVIKVRAGVGT